MKYKITAIAIGIFVFCGLLAFFKGANDHIRSDFNQEKMSPAILYDIYESVKEKDGEYLFGKTYVAYFNGACQGLMGKKCIIDPGYQVTKLDNGYLAYTVFNNGGYQRDYTEYVGKLEHLEKQLNENGIHLTFSNVIERNPLYDLKMPYKYLTVDQSITELPDLLSDKGMSAINMMNSIQNSDIDHYSLFYKTDHHWNVYGGFYAAQLLIDELGYETDEQIKNISSYTAKNTESCFLGSLGRRVGPIYGGLDDFAVLYPQFETSFTVTTYDEVRSGDFANSVIFKEHLPQEDGNISTVAYGAFLGGDFGLQTVKNNMCNNGKKVLLVRDSYGGAVSPYLALACEELHIIDMRHYDGLPIAEYAAQADIDDVVIMYSSGSLTNRCFNFDME